MEENYFDFVKKITNNNGVIKEKYLKILLEIVTQIPRHKCNCGSESFFYIKNIGRIDSGKNNMYCDSFMTECKKCHRIEFYNFNELLREYYKNNEDDTE